MKIKIIIGIVFLACLVASFIAGRVTKKENEKIKIVTETKTKFEYIKKASTLTEYKDCYNNKLGIFASVREDWIDIIALDGCKQATKSIKVAPVMQKNFIFVSGGYKFIQASYYRRWNGILFGGGVSYPLNAHIGVGYSF